MACVLCKRNPTAHSFKYFGKTTDGTSLYYTAPAQATARDDAQSLCTLRTHLAEVEKPWIWVLDCTGMQIQNQFTMQFSVAFADMLVAEHASFLRRIIIIHPNPWIYRVLHILSQEIKDCVQYANRPIELVRATTNFTYEAKTWLRLAVKS